ncbi:MAG: ATP-binding protein [Candidatus Rokubacteria bacterium]|nr:ATP-binding protein [Candidatus Rokubacteria bacterium]MBI2492023.1 ATP-binding protein [Candidatus Rokubacteria bacterium]MBI4253439.1 ATP-binding protein [Candidatus Rokubacteria bacterium]
MFERHTTPRLLAALRTRPVVLVNGPRQAGKSTLARWIAEGPHQATYVTFDDAVTLAAARNDPGGFLDARTGNLVLDEVQKVTDLFPAIKLRVDRDRRPGRFLLTGSADVLLLPNLSESLAGRVEIHTLWPLSQGEIEGVREGFIDAVFGEGALPLDIEPEPWPSLVERIVRGGYPEVVGGPKGLDREEWFRAYVTTILQREIRSISEVAGLTALPDLLMVLAARATGLVNYAELSRSTTLPQTTLKRYMALLRLIFIVETLPAWLVNTSQRLIKSPKLLLTDTGLLTHLRGHAAESLLTRRDLVGPLLETFVAAELRKQAGWSRTRPALHHFRTTEGREVDIVLEARTGRLVGIEVTASATPGAADFKSLALLAEVAGKRFHRGILLYTGTQAVPFGENLFALPVSALWRVASEQARAA